MPSDDIIVKNSAIHGQGVYAARDFEKGEVVVLWSHTKELNHIELNALPEIEKHYVDIQGDRIFLLGIPERFINHSCDANTFPGRKCDVAARTIKKGEEITADYSNFFIPGSSFQCSCDSPHCRGLITGKI